MARPVEELTENNLALELGSAKGRVVAVGCIQGELTACRILGTRDGIVFDPYGLEPGQWEVRDAPA